MSEMNRKSSAYVWFDAEFTSLDLDNARLLQVAAIITDTELKRIALDGEDLNLCIRLAEGEPVSPWVAEHLPGLVARCRSDQAVSLDDADERLAALLDRYCGTPCETMDRRPVMAGNSVHNDWYLMRRLLPKFGSRLHYRLLDVSTLKTQWQDWIGGEPFDKEDTALLNEYLPGGGIETVNAHDALFDIQASIAELAYYRAKLAPGA